MEDNYISYFLITGLAIFCTLAFLIVVSIPNPPEVQRNLSEYTCYLDGQEVDLNKVDLSLYDKTFDDDFKIIYITKKSDPTVVYGGSGFVPGLATGYLLGGVGK